MEKLVPESKNMVHSDWPLSVDGHGQDLLHERKDENGTYFNVLDGRVLESGEADDHSKGEHGGNKRYGGDGVFLHHLEQNLYDHDVKDNSVSSQSSSHHTPSADKRNSSHNGSASQDHMAQDHYNFQLDNIHFMLPEELDFEEGNNNNNNQSSAFPPSALPPTTPHMVGGKSHISNVSREPENKVFVSPVLPSQNEKSYNDQHYYHKYHGFRSADSGPSRSHVRPDAVFSPLVSPAVTPSESNVNVNKPYSAPLQTTFEPLTSPALGSESDKKRRTSSTVYGPNEEPVSAHKRRTPHGTPVLQGNDSNRAKQSPVIKTRSQRRSSYTATFERLPESSVESSEFGYNASMLPPSGKRVGVLQNNNEGPALMGFTMGRLVEQNYDDGLDDSSRSAGQQIPASEGPATNKLLPKSSSSSETSPVIEAQRSGSKSKYEKPATKKASHKIAEQGRRIRMNMAVNELGTLLPKSYHDQVAIPSKATTVELASKYIRDLVKEIEDLKTQL